MSDPVPENTSKKRKEAPDQEDPAAHECAVCLEPFQTSDATFVGPCKHAFHVQCAEQNFVVGGKTCCPLCRVEFQHAPGFVAMARAAAGFGAGGVGGEINPRVDRTRTPRNSQRAAVALPDVALPEAAQAAAPPFSLTPSFAKATVAFDKRTVAPGSTERVTALLSVRFADDDDAQPVLVPTDFVLLADVSGSMAGDKIDAVRSALLLLSDMFGPRDRVSLVAFSGSARQLTPLAPLADPAHEAAFRLAAMNMSAAGGTDIVGAMQLALRILSSRGAPNGASHVLLLTDGQDQSVREEAVLSPMMAFGHVWSTIGFGSDHDPETLAAVASRGRGTFTFQDGIDGIDEMLAAYLGNATRVLAADAVLRIEPHPGVVIASVKGPGENFTDESGAACVKLGFARVDGRSEVLVTFDATMPSDPPDTFPLFGVSVSACSATAPGSDRVVTPTLAVSFSSMPAYAFEAATESIAAATNREQLALAASAVAAAVRAPIRGPMSQHAMVDSIMQAARSSLRGSPAVRQPAEAELATLAEQVTDESRLVATANATVWRSARQDYTSPSPGGYNHASKGASHGRHRMSAKKMAR